jgi:RNA polymerase sigma factor (sigma-70 family)
MTSTAITTGELVTSARNGDQAAWESLVERYTPLLWWVTRQHRLSRDDAADVVQITWLRCVEHLSQLRDPLAFGSWLFATCRNESVRAVRVSSRTLPSDLTVESSLHGTPQGDENPEDVILQEEAGMLLRQAVAELSPRQRDVLLTLMEIDIDGAYEAASRRLNIPIGSMGPTRQRAIARLREDERLISLR